ncbi:MAG: nucleotide-binding universal stress UspA family protein [Rickettsiales bacterium]|jgi:nucleotide-binding universal stress UspA family protein
MSKNKTTKNKILTCVDGSNYANNICDLALWAQTKLHDEITILHIDSLHTDIMKSGDLSGAIGVGTKQGILEELSKIDEEHGKTQQQKGQAILDEAQQYLNEKGAKELTTLHLRGSLSETISGLQDQSSLIILGKRGEKNEETNRIGSNLEQTARQIHKPLLIASAKIAPINRFLIAFDGSLNGQKIIDYISSSPLFKGLECHLLQVDPESEKNKKLLKEAEEKLTNGGLQVQSYLKPRMRVENVVAEHIEEHGINLLVIGAYGHSEIRSFILGSTTNELIRKTTIPLLILR